VYRLLGSLGKAVAVADRGLDFLARHATTRSAKEEASALREAARCVAARALATFHLDERKSIEQIQAAVKMSNGADAVVNALAKQLTDHLAHRQQQLQARR
jgi:hypothetical protein